MKSLPKFCAPICLGHTRLHEEFDKIVCRESFQEPFGSISEWLLFGATKVPVVVLPLDVNGNVIALAHFRYGAGETVWELPGGSIEMGQTAKEAVKKELEQEASFVIENDEQVVQLCDGGVWFDPASSKVEFLPFIATGCKEDVKKQARDPCEHVRVERFSIHDWYAGPGNAEIRDAKSFTVSILALRHLERTARDIALNALK